MEIIDGKKISAQVKQELADEIATFVAEGKKIPHLVAVLVGNDGASETYVASKVKACQAVGMKSSELRYGDDITEEQLLAVIDKLNDDPDVDGFIVQLPLPKHISEEKILNRFNPDKDVDGFHPCNVGRMVLGLPTYLPATPAGIVELLTRYNIPTEGKHCVVVGRSNIVGTPMAVLMSRKAKNANCTVTLCHSRTTNLKDGAVVVDVGIHRMPSDTAKNGGQLVGDVDYDHVAPKCSYITPVPGGVGPMTIVTLLQNTLKACKAKH